MAFCNNCGAQIDDKAVICPKCGAAQRGGAVANPEDSGSVGWWFLGFIFPLIGLILFLVWKGDKPKSAKMAGMGALIMTIIQVVLGVILGLVFGGIIAAYM